MRRKTCTDCRRQRTWATAAILSAVPWLRPFQPEGKPLDQNARTAPAVLARVGRRRGCLPDDGDLCQRTHGFLVALSPDPRRVRMGARHHGRGVLLRLHRLRRAEPDAGPAHGPSRSALRDGGRRRRHGRGPPAAATFAAEPWHVYLTLGLLVGAGTTFTGYTGQALFLPNWFVRRRGLAMSIAFAGVGFGSIVILPRAADVRGAKRLACRVHAAGPGGARRPRSPQPASPAATRGTRPGTGRRRRHAGGGKEPDG